MGHLRDLWVICRRPAPPPPAARLAARPRARPPPRGPGGAGAPRGSPATAGAARGGSEPRRRARPSSSLSSAGAEPRAGRALRLPTSRRGGGAAASLRLARWGRSCGAPSGARGQGGRAPCARATCRAAAGAELPSGAAQRPAFCKALLSEGPPLAKEAGARAPGGAAPPRRAGRRGQSLTSPALLASACLGKPSPPFRRASCRLRRQSPASLAAARGLPLSPPRAAPTRLRAWLPLASSQAARASGRGEGSEARGSRGLPRRLAPASSSGAAPPLSRQRDKAPAEALPARLARSSQNGILKSRAKARRETHAQ